jgi:glucosylceramidase
MSRRLAAPWLRCSLLLCTLAGLSACASPEVALPLSGAGKVALVAAWVTTGDRTRLLSVEPGIAFSNVAPAGAQTVEVDPATRYQTMVGFGASLTDASAWLMQHKLSAAQREALLQELFGRGPGGAGFEFARLTIGASDFSRSHYSLADQAPGQTDRALHSFSIAPNRADVLPLIQRARAINPQLQVMASPWSAPGWMKTTDSLVKGTLKPEMFDAFAEYLVRYVEAYAAEGVPIFALTVQNEPHFEPDDYPGMRLDPAQRARLASRFLAPLLAQRKLNTQIIEWDHNWDEPQSPAAVLADPAARAAIGGVGWHCYAGTVDVQAKVHVAYPDKDAWFTECSGGRWKTNWAETLPWMMRNLVIGATRGWARGVLFWNLALDENDGPHLGGCKDCRGVVTIDSRSGAVTRNMEYYALAHASRHVRSGAQRIASSAGQDGIDTVAFRNADDGSRVLLVCNSAAAMRGITVQVDGRHFSATLARESVATYVWAAPAAP